MDAESEKQKPIWNLKTFFLMASRGYSIGFKTKCKLMSEWICMLSKRSAKEFMVLIASFKASPINVMFVCK